jgi:DNA-binding GntR family transcriptional regulator
MDADTRPRPRGQELPLVEQAYQALKRALIRCEFEPGQRLRVEELQQRYGFSSTPLREALNRLVQQGFVKVLENRGFRVAPISVEAIHDLTRVRLLIESEALRDAIAHGDDQWETGIVGAFHGLSVAEKRLPPGPAVLNDDWSERHRTFHLSTYAACTSPLLKEMTEVLFDQAERFRRYSARFRKGERSKTAEHQHILDAVIARDTEHAVSLLQEHIRATERNVAASLREREATVARQ